MDKVSNTELVGALVAFAVAANTLLDKWYESGDDALVGYPEAWAAFEDVAANATLWANENVRAVGGVRAVQGPAGQWVIVKG